MTHTEYMTVEVTLKSDMCCGTGESDGSYVDQLTAVDWFGLPIIPGKRLKGLLRENAEHIAIAFPDLRKSVDAVFGLAGQDTAKIKILTAELVDSKSLQSYVSNNKIAPKRVTDAYTSVRFNTQIDNNGIAKEHSLRSTQVINHTDKSGTPTVFEFVIESYGLNDEEKKLVSDAVTMLRRIGLNKNRGFGEVLCKAGEFKAVAAGSGAGYGAMLEDKTMAMAPSEDKTLHQDDDKSADIITRPYQITLEQDVILAGGIGQDLDYFPGSMLQGAFARYAGLADDPDLIDNLLNATCFSNAYVDINSGDKKLTSHPVPNIWIEKKNARATSSSSVVLDMSLDPKREPATQYVPLSGYYAKDCAADDNARIIKTVSNNYSFHNSLKKGEMKKQFYSHKVVAAGQSFSGTITCDKTVFEQLNTIMEKRGGSFIFGSAGSTQFGQCHVTFGETLNHPTIEANVQHGAEINAQHDCVVVDLLSDVVFIDNKANNSTNIADFLEHLSATKALGFEFEPQQKSVTNTDGSLAFIKTATIGGYNSYWKLPKRQYRVFQKGSVLVLKNCKIEKDIPATTWIGHLHGEGFGQVRMRTVDDITNAEAQFLVREEQTVEAGLGVNGEFVCGEPESSSAATTSVVSATAATSAVDSFVSSLNFNEAKLALIISAINCAGQIKESTALSKSAAMRLSNAYYSTINDTGQNTRTRLQSFCGIEFSNTNSGAELNKMATRAATDFKNTFTTLPSIEIDSFSAREQNMLFDTFMQNFIKQLKIYYSVEDD